MDHLTGSPTGLKAHNVEIYTAALLIRGTIYGSFERTSDLMNRWDRSNVIVEDVALSPLGQASNPKRISEPLFVPREQIHFVTASPTAENNADPVLPDPSAASHLRSLLGVPADLPASRREFVVQRVTKLCHAFTSVFIISGMCHLLAGSTIENILDGQTPFFPLTQATIHLNLYPESPWRRNLVLINKLLLQAIYTVDPPSHVPNSQQTPPS